MTDRQLCGDCPDHEACMTGWPCAVVRNINQPAPVAPPTPSVGPDDDLEESVRPTGPVRYRKRPETRFDGCDGYVLAEGASHAAIAEAAQWAVAHGATVPYFNSEGLLLRQAYPEDYGDDYAGRHYHEWVEPDTALIALPDGIESFSHAYTTREYDLEVPQ